MLTPIARGIKPNPVVTAVRITGFSWVCVERNANDEDGDKRVEDRPEQAHLSRPEKTDPCKRQDRNETLIIYG